MERFALHVINNLDFPRPSRGGARGGVIFPSYGTSSVTSKRQLAKIALPNESSPSASIRTL